MRRVLLETRFARTRVQIKKPRCSIAVKTVGRQIVVSRLGSRTKIRFSIATCGKNDVLEGPQTYSSQKPNPPGRGTVFLNVHTFFKTCFELIRKEMTNARPPERDFTNEKIRRFPRRDVLKTAERTRGRGRSERGQIVDAAGAFFTRRPDTCRMHIAYNILLFVRCRHAA